MKRTFLRSWLSALTLFFFVSSCLLTPAAEAYHVTLWYQDGQNGGAANPSGNGGGPGNGEMDPESGSGGSPCEGDPVYLHSGEFFYQCTSLTVPGRGMDVVINHKYRGGKAYNGQFGHGWTMNYYQRIRTLNNGNVVWLQGSGREDEFTYSGGTYESPKGIYVSLVQNGNGTWTLTYPNGTKYIFDINGLLAEIRDRNNNSITFAYSVSPVAVYSYPLFPRTSPVVSPIVVGYDYQLTSITDTVGRVINLTYNSDGKLDEITDFDGRVVSFGYDANTGDLLTITKPATTQYPLGVTKTFAYNTNHKIESITDARGQTFVTNYYDSEGRVYQQDLGTGSYLFNYGVGQTTVTDRNGYDVTYTIDGDANSTGTEVFTDGLRVGEPASYISTQTRDAEGNLASVTYPEGNGAIYTYDVTNPDRKARGNLLQIRRKADMTQPDDNNADLITTATYESTYNQLKTLTDPKGNVYTVIYDYELSTLDPKYDTKGNAVQVTMPTVNAQTPTWNMTYNTHGQITKVEDPNGNVTDYTYHTATGYLHEVIRDPSGINAKWTLTYDAIGNIDTVTDAEGRVTDYDFNDLHWLTRVQNDLGYVTQVSHDQNGNVLKVERQVDDPVTTWQTAEFTYDVLNNLKTVKDPLNRTTTYNYDASENLTSIVDAELNTTTYEYDERHFLFKHKDANTPQGVTTYDYDDNGNLAKITDAESNETTYGYDGYDRTVSKTYDDTSGSTYAYDKNSNLTKHTTPRGDDIDYTYDVLNRRLTKTYDSDSSLDITYTYDVGSRLLTADNTASDITYTYDALNRVATNTQRVNANNFVVSYNYDDVSNRTQVTYPSSKVVDYTYDNLNRMTHVDVNSSALLEYSYDPLNRRAEKSFLSANLPRTAYEYDLANQLEAMTNVVLAGAETITNQLSAPLDNITSSIAPDSLASQFTYTHDQVGNRSTMAVSGTLGTTGTHTYTYNDIYELEGVSGADSHSYAYDNVGNRTTADSVSYTSNGLNQYTAVGSTIYLYDGNDNLANDGTNSYTYDESNRLISASNSSHTASYTYDAFNRRVSKTVDGTATYFVYDGREVIEEYNSSNVLQADYVMGSRIDEPLTMTRGGTTYYYHCDGLGSVRQLTNTSGTIVESYDYDPYGNTTIYDSSLTDITSTGSGIDNPYMYTGRRLDQETGIYHYRARQYDPAIGRFLQRDPIGYKADMNLFRYTWNSPINYTDPTGMFPQIPVPPIPSPVGGSSQPLMCEIDDGEGAFPEQDPFPPTEPDEEQPEEEQPQEENKKDDDEFPRYFPARPATSPLTPVIIDTSTDPFRIYIIVIPQGIGIQIFGPPNDDPIILPYGGGSPIS